MANVIATAINSEHLQVRAYVMAEKPAVFLEHQRRGSVGNDALEESVDDEDFKVEGMEGGGGEGCPEDIGCVNDDDCERGLECGRDKKCR
jgi:hypothetical protein